MTAKELKNALLQEAVQGKLVPQIASEGNARDLLDQIKKEKAKLVKKEKLKKEKPLPEITTEYIPFDIPENWCWCKLGDIVNKLTDGTHRTPKYVEKGIPFLSVKNLSSGKMDFENTKFITLEEHKELYARCNPEKGDMLLTKVGTTGIPVINDSDIEFSLFVSVALIKFNHNFLDAKFFLYLLQSPLVQDQAKENTRGVGNKNWVMDAIANTLLILPPLAEQKRIVTAIEKFMPLIDEYGRKENELTVLNKEIAKKLKNAILQEAVQGKLVPQIAVEGNAKDLLGEIKKEKAKLVKEGKLKKEKPLPEITEDEIPYDIPENWCWCRLGYICEIARGGSPRPIKDYLTTNEDGYNWIKIGDTDKNGKYINHTEEKIKKEGLHKTRLVHKGDFLLTNSMSFGRPYILNIEGCIHDGWLVISPSKDIFNKDYLYYLLSSEFAYNQFCDSVSGAVVKNLNSDKVREALFPLPPLIEQKRIVEAIEKILPLCEKLGD